MDTWYMILLYVLGYLGIGIACARQVWRARKYIPPLYSAEPNCGKDHKHHEDPKKVLNEQKHDRYSRSYYYNAADWYDMEPGCYPVEDAGQGIPGDGTMITPLAVFIWPAMAAALLGGGVIYGIGKGLHWLITSGESENERLIRQRKELRKAENDLKDTGWKEP